MAVPDEIELLVENLRVRTRKGLVRWTETSGGKRYYTNLEDASAQTYTWHRTAFTADGDEYLEDVIAFELMDPEGNHLFQANVGETDTGYNDFKAFFDAVNMQAKDVPGIIDKIIKRFDSEDRITNAEEKLSDMHEEDPSTLCFANERLLKQLPIEVIDEAYARLLKRGVVERAPQTVSISGHPRHVFRWKRKGNTP